MQKYWLTDKYWEENLVQNPRIGRYCGLQDNPVPQDWNFSWMTLCGGLCVETIAVYSPGYRLLIVYYFCLYCVRSSISVKRFLHSNRLKKKCSSLIHKTFPITYPITTFHWYDKYILKKSNQKIILNFSNGQLDWPFAMSIFHCSNS